MKKDPYAPYRGQAEESPANWRSLEHHHRELDTKTVLDPELPAGKPLPSDVNRRDVAVAVEAPDHRERLLLVNDLHRVDAAVAGLAADRGAVLAHADAHVHGVIEVGEVGDLVNALPRHRRVVGPALAQRLERFGVFADLPVAVHAGLGRRYARVRAALDVGVAVAAVEAEAGDLGAVGERGLLADGAGVQLVAVGDRLLRPVADVGVPGRSPPVEGEDAEASADEADHGDPPRSLVGPLGENLRHVVPSCAAPLVLKVAGCNNTYSRSAGAFASRRGRLQPSWLIGEISDS